MKPSEVIDQKRQKLIEDISADNTGLSEADIKFRDSIVNLAAIVDATIQYLNELYDRGKL